MHLALGPSKRGPVRSAGGPSRKRPGGAWRISTQLTTGTDQVTAPPAQASWRPGRSGGALGPTPLSAVRLPPCPGQQPLLSRPPSSTQAGVRLQRVLPRLPPADPGHSAPPPRAPLTRSCRRDRLWSCTSYRPGLLGAAAGESVAGVCVPACACVGRCVRVPGGEGR